MFRDVILSEAKNFAIKRINYLRDPSMPSAAQDGTYWTCFGKQLGRAVVTAAGITKNVYIDHEGVM